MNNKACLSNGRYTSKMVGKHEFVVVLVSHFVSQQECVSIVNGYENYNDAYIYIYIKSICSRLIDTCNYYEPPHKST